MHQHDIRTIERSAVTEISQLIQEELGLQPAASRAEWTQDSMTVTFIDALTPIGQATQATDSNNLLAPAYNTLYHLHCLQSWKQREQLHNAAFSH